MKYTFSLGKDYIYWCIYCNLPLLEEQCNRCKENGEKVNLSPPADIRFISKKGLELIKTLFLKSYGVSDFLKDRIILLNKIAGLDRCDQIFIDGYNIATLSYNIKKKDYSLNLSVYGAMILATLTDKKTVICNKKKLAGRHLKGKTIDKEAVIEFADDIEAGDDIILKVGNSIGVGTAKVSTKTFPFSENAVLKVRDISSKLIKLSPNKPLIAEVVEANLPYLKKIESVAINELKSYLSGKTQKVNVAFSGGKDSLVVLELAKKVVKDFDVIFVDTGLEFPETIGYVKKICNQNNCRLNIASAGNAFLANFGFFGPPGKDFRWCCKTCKLAPLSELIEQKYPNGCITIEGNRRYESFSRAKLNFVERNPFVPNQITLNPIRNWKAIEVWLYIYWEKLPYNPLYDMDYERIGCYLCPSSLASEFKNMIETHPSLHKDWLGRLYNWAKSNEYTKEFIDYEFWRWKLQPPKMRILAKELEIDIKPKVEEKALALQLLKGLSPCITGGYSIEGRLITPQNHSFARVANIMWMLGKVRFSEELGVVLINGKDWTAKVFAGGQIVVTSDEPKKAERIFKDVVKATIRVQMCTRCKICEKNCKRKAIKIKDTVYLDQSKCIRCGKCNEGCVVVKYYDKLISSIS